MVMWLGICIHHAIDLSALKRRLPQGRYTIATGSYMKDRYHAAYFGISVHLCVLLLAGMHARLFHKLS